MATDPVVIDGNTGQPVQTVTPVAVPAVSFDALMKQPALVIAGVAFVAGYLFSKYEGSSDES